MIRPARPEDAPAIATLGQFFHSTHPLSSLVSYDWDHVVRTTQALIASPDACVFVAEGSEYLAGMIAGVLVPVLFHPTAKIVSEVAWYMHPMHRATRDGLRLLHAFEEWAHSTFAVGMAMVSHIHYPDVAAIYARHGYTLHESTYVKAF